MPLDELNNSLQPPVDWLPLDNSLLGEGRPTLPTFPLHLLPGRWRTWVEASSRVFGSADYLAHCLLGGVAGVGGAGIRVAVASHWEEPLLLWQALVGGPSSGKSAAFARVVGLLAEVRPRTEGGVDGGDGATASEELAAPRVLVDAGLDRLSLAQSGNALGVLLWREDLADWMAGASARTHRAAWLAGWSAGPTRIGNWANGCFAVGLLGALAPDCLSQGRLAVGTDGGSALASRLLYAWPERGAAASLADTDADDEGIVALLQKIAAFAGHRETPCIVPLDKGAARRLEALMPAIQERADEADGEGGGVAAEWIGRGVATVVRLAGVLSLMEWAEASEESGAEYLPVGAAHIEAAHALWSGYYLPHALAVFDRSGGRPGDRAARRVVRWLKRVRAPEVSREEVRREALCQSVDADGAEEVLARLEAAGFLRPLAAGGSAKGGPRRRRWEVNPQIGGWRS